MAQASGSAKGPLPGGQFHLRTPVTTRRETTSTVAACRRQPGAGDIGATDRRLRINRFRDRSAQTAAIAGYGSLAQVNEPRRQHLVPVFYLQGFTRQNRRSDTLHVFDYSTGKRYRTSPNRACRETDFFRVDDGDEDPQLMERILAEHEATIARFIQQVVADRRATDRRQVGEALSLAAVLAARSRRRPTTS